MKKIQMVDLQSQYHRFKPEIDSAMQEVIESSAFINGPAVKQFQTALAEYLNVKHVITCGNGTDALQAALVALDLQPGDEIITTSFTFIATVEVIGLLNLTPVLVDVDPDTYTIDTEQVEAAVTPRTKAIIPVHLFGQGAEMQKINTIAEKHSLYIVEDAAQCLGADYNTPGGKQKLGTLGNIGCTSFFPSKNLGCFGDGGACMTNDDVLAEKLRMFVNHGAKKKYYHETIGVNSRLDTLQAAILNIKLPHLDEFNQSRQEVAAFYDNAFKNIDGLQIPVRNSNSEHVFHQYVMRIKNGKRDELKEWLQQRDIPSMVYYPVALHKQPAFRKWITKELSLPVSEQLTEEVLALPVHTEMTKEQLEHIKNGVSSFFNK